MAIPTTVAIAMLEISWLEKSVPSAVLRPSTTGGMASASSGASPKATSLPICDLKTWSRTPPGSAGLGSFLVDGGVMCSSCFEISSRSPSLSNVVDNEQVQIPVGGNRLNSPVGPDDLQLVLESPRRGRVCCYPGVIASADIAAGLCELRAGLLEQRRSG